MFKVNNKNTRMTLLSLSLTFLYLKPFSKVSLFPFEQTNVFWAEAAGYRCVVE